MATPLRIDFVSDVVCPWCVIGLRALSKALEEIGDAADVELVFQPFELNPSMAPEGQNVTEHVRQKYGSTPEKSAASREMIRQNGERLGFTFNYSEASRIWNTFDAHRLLHWALEQGRQRELKEELFAATFTAQRDISDPAVLADVAAEAGLDAEEARAILASVRYAAEVRADEALWRNRGISAVPSIVFDERWMMQGAQAPEAFVHAIRQIVAEKAKQAAS